MRINILNLLVENNFLARSRAASPMRSALSELSWRYFITCGKLSKSPFGVRNPATSCSIRIGLAPTSRATMGLHSTMASYIANSPKLGLRVGNIAARHRATASLSPVSHLRSVRTDALLRSDLRRPKWGHKTDYRYSSNVQPYTRANILGKGWIPFSSRPCA